MEKYLIETDKEGREINAYLNPVFPLVIQKTKISNYYLGHLTIHWHQDFELLHILDGELEYSVNGRMVHLLPGEGLFVNSRQVHTGRQLANQDCGYIYVRFEPELIGGFEGGRIYEKFFQPIIESENLPYIHLKPDIPWQEGVLRQMETLERIKRCGKADAEIQMVQETAKLWTLLYNNCGQSIVSELESGSNAKGVKQALLFIQSHFNERITLKEIAHSCNCSKSECCRIFKKIVGQSPLDYVNTYRIKKSLGLIATGEHSMTEIAYMVGFSSSSYFAEVFRQQMECSPTAYRRSLFDETGILNRKNL